MTIYVKEWNVNPGLRYEKQSPKTSGELFYMNVLKPQFVECYAKNDILTVVLDGTEGYAYSFLDEAFGRLVYDFTEETVLKKLIIITKDEPYFERMLQEQTFTEWETRRQKKSDFFTCHPITGVVFLCLCILRVIGSGREST